MRAIGKFTTLIGTAAAALALVIGIRSIPDFKRYIKMRDM